MTLETLKWMVEQEQKLKQLEQIVIRSEYVYQTTRNEVYGILKKIEQLEAAIEELRA